MLNRNLLVLLPLFFVTGVQAEDNVRIKDSLQHFDESQWWLADGWENGFPFLSRWEAEAVKFGRQGMRISLAPDPKRNNDGSYNFYSGEVRSHDFYTYGCFEIDMKPVKAPGVITSFFLFSGPYDKPADGNGIHNEIDVEFLGSNTNMVQMNYWTDDDNYSNSHETIIFLDFDASKDFHRYGIYWSENSIEWFIDGKSVLKVLDSQFDPIPSISSSRLRMMFNVWATDPQIANWAGKFKETKKKTYTAVYKNFSYMPQRRCLS